jgi:effector-binding domain-containing protein
MLPGGTTATIAHFGPHDSLPLAHAHLDAWIEAGGYIPAGPRWEVYVSDSALESYASRWSTRLFQPLAER